VFPKLQLPLEKMRVVATPGAKPIVGVAEVSIGSLKVAVTSNVEPVSASLMRGSLTAIVTVGGVVSPVTVSVKGAVAFTASPSPIMALMVIVWLPSGAVIPTLTVIVEVKLGVPLAGEKLMVTPDGAPVALRSTEGPPGFTAVTVTVGVVEPPRGTEPDEGETLTYQVLSVKVVVAVLVPSVAVTVYVPCTPFNVCQQVKLPSLSAPT